ncbi:hypothetical protein IWW52_001927 [Coemansia sp. RSA 2704]|nr:hypothetical protein IWW54_002255 [Coemansia sp. RSA 2705]KAJ2319506.1 hypothetical protein IWW52_001927 [Coemansia sp. RSA 2704]
MYPFPSHSVTASQHSMPAYGHESSWRGDAFTKSLPASIPLPGVLDIGPRLSQADADRYSYENPAMYSSQRHQVLSYPPAHGECRCSDCCYSGYDGMSSYDGMNGYDNMGGYVHSVPRRSPSPPLQDSSCSCCPRQPHYGVHPYYEPAEQLASSMPIPMPTPMGYLTGSMPAYAPPTRQRPRKRVTFADPIAEVKVVPRHSSSAPEQGSQSPMPHFPAQLPTVSRRERRSSVGAQVPDSEYSSQALINDFKNLTSSYTLNPKTDKSHRRSSSSSSGHKKRNHPCTPLAEAEVPCGAEARKSSNRRKGHELRKPDSSAYPKNSAYPKDSAYAYDGRFSLSIAHLPLHSQTTPL